MKIYLFLMFFIFVSTACKNNPYDVDVHCNRVTFQTSDELKKKYNLQTGGFGGSALHGVAEFSLGFSIQKKLSIPEARTLLVHSVELFLKNINSDKNLRPILVEYPFPATRIDFFVETTDGTYDPWRKPGELKSFVLRRGKIAYKTVQEEGTFKAYSKTEIMHTETYEEAKRIVDNEKNS